MTLTGPAQYELGDLRCPGCKSADLRIALPAGDISRQIADEGVRCGACDRRYDVIWGVPYLGVLQRQDVLSLFEMVSHAGEYLRADAEHESFQSVLDALEEYTRASDKDGVLRRRGFHPKPAWWDHRYHEQVEFSIVTRGLDFTGAKVLDVGAGMGSDSLRYHTRGATLTALEFSFSVFGPGSRLYPRFRWIGGAAHTLPFGSETFDCVVAHNSLHHHTDPSVSVSEMLRVLRPGGHLLTTGDPFKSDDQSEFDECVVFDTHPNVLTGTNEQIPAYSTYVKSLERYADALDIRAFVVDSATDHCHERVGEQVFAARNTIRSGGLSLRVRKTKAVEIPEQPLGDSVVRPGDYARRLLSGPAQAFEVLADAIDERHLNLSLLDRAYPKFRQLNGWKLARDGETTRTAYKRGRLFYGREHARHAYAHVSVLVPAVRELNTAVLRLKVDDVVILERELLRGVWHDLAAPLPPGVQPRRAFTFEIGVSNGSGSDSDRGFVALDDALLFRVARVDFSDEPGAPASTPRLQECSVDNLGACGVLGDAPVVLCAPDYYLALDVINRLAPHARQIQLVIPGDQDPFYEWLAGVTIVDRYENTTAVAPPGRPRFATDVVIAPNIESLRLLEPVIAPVRTDGSARGQWLVTGDGRVTRLAEALGAIAAGRDDDRSPLLRRARRLVRRIPFSVQLWHGVQRLRGVWT